MSLWVDKYRPRTLDSLSTQPSLTRTLRALGREPRDLPHLLIHGPSGTGKKTRCLALLENIFGNGVYKLKVDVRQFVGGSRKLELNVVSSPYHLEITPSDAGMYDRLVVQELLKEVAQMEQVDFQESREGLAHRYKVVVVNEAHALTRDAQAALRRTMEKYSGNIRLIMLADSVASLIAPIRSRFLCIRVPAPSPEEITQTLTQVAQSENVELQGDPQVVLKSIVEECHGNLRLALLMLESMSLANELKISASTPLIRPDWATVVIKLAAKIIKERNVKSIMECRSIIYDLLAHCIPARIILKELTLSILNQLDSLAGSSKDISKIKIEVLGHSSIFDERLSLGNKSIYHLEGFIAKTMCCID